MTIRSALWRRGGARRWLEVSGDPDEVIAEVVQSLVTEGGPRNRVEGLIAPSAAPYDTGACRAWRLASRADWDDFYTVGDPDHDLPDPAVEEVWILIADQPRRVGWIRGAELRRLFDEAWTERPPPRPGATSACG